MHLPHRERVVVPLRKITAYLRDGDHPDGGPKARFFIACGYSPEEPEVLAASLRTHCVQHEVANVRESKFGLTYAVDGTPDAPDGTRPVVRSVWIIEPDSDRPIFVTAYPKRG